MGGSLGGGGSGWCFARRCRGWPAKVFNGKKIDRIHLRDFLLEMQKSRGKKAEEQKRNMHGNGQKQGFLPLFVGQLRCRETVGHGGYVIFLVY